MHHGTCVTDVPWCMSGSLTRGGGENVPGIHGTCATCSFTYLIRGPWPHFNGLTKPSLELKDGLIITSHWKELWMWWLLHALILLSHVVAWCRIIWSYAITILMHTCTYVWEWHYRTFIYQAVRRLIIRYSEVWNWLGIKNVISFWNLKVVLPRDLSDFRHFGKPELILAASRLHKKLR